MFKLLKTIAISVLLLSVSGCDLPADHPCVGKWKAEGRDVWFDVRDVNEVYIENSVRYPQRLGAAKPTDNFVRFHHNGTMAKLGCTDTGAILFSANGDKLLFKPMI